MRKSLRSFAVFQRRNLKRCHFGKIRDCTLSHQIRLSSLSTLPLTSSRMRRFSASSNTIQKSKSNASQIYGAGSKAENKRKFLLSRREEGRRKNSAEGKMNLKNSSLLQPRLLLLLWKVLS